MSLFITFPLPSQRVDVSTCAWAGRHPAQGRGVEAWRGDLPALAWLRTEGGMSDGQSPRWRVQGAPGGRGRRRLLGVGPRVAAGLVLHLGHAAPLAQAPVPQQPVCPREVLGGGKREGEREERL